jgi:hypothetical protein
MVHLTRAEVDRASRALSGTSIRGQADPRGLFCRPCAIDIVDLNQPVFAG